jgi:hypothetical protein
MNANESLARVGPVLRTRALEKQYGRGPPPRRRDPCSRADPRFETPLAPMQRQGEGLLKRGAHLDVAEVAFMVALGAAAFVRLTPVTSRGAPMERSWELLS